MNRPASSPDATFAPLVIDDDGEDIRRWCSTDALPPGDLERRGLPELRCSTSAQFSAAGLRWVLERLARSGPSGVWVVDLRQESHGFVDGAAVSWYAQNNWGNVGLDPEEVGALETLRLKMLADGATVRVGRADLAKTGQVQVFETRTVRDVLSEQALVARHGGRYVRIPVTDHATPSREVLQTFIHLVGELPAGSWLHIHCRGGKGRSAMFLAIYDVLRNAARVELGTIIARIRRLTGYDLEKPADPQSAKAPHIAERLPLLRALHERRRREAV